MKWLKFDDGKGFKSWVVSDIKYINKNNVHRIYKIRVSEYFHNLYQKHVTDTGITNDLYFTRNGKKYKCIYKISEKQLSSDNYILSDDFEENIVFTPMIDIDIYIERKKNYGVKIYK